MEMRLVAVSVWGVLLVVIFRGRGGEGEIRTALRRTPLKSCEG